MTTADSAPERIWVQGATWHEHKNALAAGGEPVEYIRADLYESLTAERDAQAKQIEELKAILDNPERLQMEREANESSNNQRE